jgi:hypothetical protein
MGTNDADYVYNLGGKRNDIVGIYEMMIRKDGENRSAVLSKDNRYRYRLERRWDEGAPVVFVMLNPSTADGFTDDQTIAKCRRFAQRWNRPAFVVVNLYALRSTDPHALTYESDPIGPENNFYIREAAYEAIRGGSKVVCAWGTKFLGTRDRDVTNMLRAWNVDLWSLAITKNGHPGHPLYLRGNAELKPYE